MGLKKEGDRTGPNSGAGPGDKRPQRVAGSTVGYFRRVGDALEQGFEEKEEKDLFIANVLEEVWGQELNLCTHASVSIVLERLLGHCGGPHLRRFLGALRPHYAQLSCHRCGAHVVQTALLQAARLGGQLQAVEEETSDGGSLEALIRELSASIRERLLDCARDAQGSFVLRTLLQVLGGTVLSTEDRKRNPRQKAARVFVTHPIASPVLQVALRVLSRKLPAVSGELCGAVIKYLGSLGQAEGCSPLLVFLKDKVSSRLLENIIQASDKKLFRKLYKSHFRGQLVSLALHPIANYTVQRLLAASPSQKLFSKLFDELCPALEDILAQGHMGIITELVAACVKHKEKQQAMLMRLYQAFHCYEPASRRLACVPLVVSLLTYEVFYNLDGEDSTTEYQPSEEKRLEAVSYHGSLLMQHLLHFDEPAAVVRSMAAVSQGDHIRLACDQAGSHVYDALLTSSTVSGKQRRKIIRKLTGQFAQLACDKYGSRVLDQIWKSVPIGMKRSIAEELAGRERELQSDPIGCWIARNFALAHFQKRRRLWDEYQVAESKRRKMFAELLED
ncbi:nucleolar protein 9-like isoform X2 [Heterodontus francisci]|uniref:nucleolar protein 9-like isoform X2 n=1 Tax=Heterodontus francisci TaxID=7792 RepID=UPI00355C384D